MYDTYRINEKACRDVMTASEIGTELFRTLIKQWEKNKDMAQMMFSGETLLEAIEKRKKEDAAKEARQNWESFLYQWDEIGKIVFLENHKVGRCLSSRCSCLRKKPTGNVV